MPRKSPLDNVLETAGAAQAAPQVAASPAAFRQSLAVVADAEMKAADAQDAELHKTLLTEATVTLSLAPMYQPYFGRNMPVGLNSSMIYFPVDGRQYKVPRSFASIIHERRRRVDDFLMRKGRMADVRNNHENFIGELKIY